MRLISLLLTVILPLMIMSSGNVQAADWALDNTNSRISFMTIKEGEIAELHTFQKFSGSVDKAGLAKVAIELNSVETNIDIRNERMREFLFETIINPEVDLTSKLDMKNLKRLKLGERKLLEEQAFKIGLHGIETEIYSDVFVTRVSARKVLVETASPILIHAEDFNFGAGILKLRELAGLDSITPIVPVTASLLFTK